MRNLVRLIVFLLIVHAFYRFVPVYLHYHQFKDGVGETALFSKDVAETEILEKAAGIGLVHARA